MGLSFDGTDDEVSIPLDSPVPDSDFTIMGWFRADTPATFDTLFMQGTGDPATRTTRIAWSAGTPRIEVQRTGEDSQKGTLAITLSAWHHFAWTLSGTTDTVYLDGAVSAGSRGLGLGLTGNNWLGRKTSGNLWEGDLANWRVYDRAVTAVEIATIYVARGGDGIVYGLRPCWPMNEGAPGTAAASGATIIDISGGRHGTPGASTAAPTYVMDNLRARRRAA